jgi:hypothetical protein
VRKLDLQPPITWRRAFLIVVIPPLGVWKQVRENPDPGDKPFTRRPRAIELARPLLGLGFVVAGLIAGISAMTIIAAFLAAVFAIAPLARRLMPRSVAHSECESLVLTVLIRPSHLVILALLLYLSATGQWLSIAIIVGMLVPVLVAGVVLVRVVSGGIIRRGANHGTG